jgi:hypothetical protein
MADGSDQKNPVSVTHNKMSAIPNTISVSRNFNHESCGDAASSSTPEPAASGRPESRASAESAHSSHLSIIFRTPQVASSDTH